MNRSLRINIVLVFVCLIVLISSTSLWAQPGQLSVSRVDQMPDFPQPYFMRDWQAVTKKYDAFVFDMSKTGTYLPLSGLGNSGVNYPTLKPILLNTYVGSGSATQAEAINILPALVGASLTGIDKSMQDGVNWVEKTKDFFNAANHQNVYLNSYSALSGNDWWYDLMPNVFFFQLSTLYSDDAYPAQINAVADQWLAAVQAMGGKTMPWSVPDMNYRAFRLSTMTGNATGVHEPEAAGAIGWLLYSAYKSTGQRKYLDGAQLSLEFLTSLTSNPSYELQLPYGTVTAARLNAVHGTSYDVGKLLSWSFDRGPLRGWGTIVGAWDGKDVAGLVGEAADNGNDYAFMMNGYQQAAALAPVIKYDKRYARALSKWILNLANASRYYYPQFLDAAKQDDNAWSTTNDPESVIGYEALKENWNGKALYGTGDAKRSGWAQTNLALYGSSHVGYLAAVVQTTNVEGILRLDLNKTDFFGDNNFPAYAYFNPHSEDKQVTISLEGVGHDLYDAISESVIAHHITTDYTLPLKPGEVKVISILPADADLQATDGKLYLGDKIVDYHYGYDFGNDLRIKSLTTASLQHEFAETLTIYAAVDNAAADVSYQWYVDDILQRTTTVGEFEWTTPSTEGTHVVRLNVSDGISTASGELTLSVMKDVPKPPDISIEQQSPYYYHGKPVQLICRADQSSTDKLSYAWNLGSESYSQQDSLITWIPSKEGLYTVTCTVTNSHDLSASVATNVLVKDDTEPEVDVLAWYPLNVDVKDYSGHGYNAGVNGTSKADDALGNADFAYRIASQDDVIYVPNALSLNFVDEMTVSCWISVSPTGREAFVLSHGSWEKRWKLSITPQNYLRWTVKTGNATVDVDSREPILANRYYHVAASYSGYSLELYIDGELDSYMTLNGSVQQADEPITFGQKGMDETQYYLNGVIDEVRIYNESLQPWQIATLKTLWHDEVVTSVEGESPGRYTPFPNPVSEGVVYLNTGSEKVLSVRLIGADGRVQDGAYSRENDRIVIDVDENIRGLVLIQVESATAVRNYKVVVR